MPNRIPSLNALRAFDAVARHHSCTKAAEHLFVTAAAVSQQIRFLEDALGVQLFHRVNRGFFLTEAGQRLWPEVQNGFRCFERAMDQMAEIAARRKLSISVAPSFALKWLLPRLKSFTSQHPEIDVWVTTSPLPVDLNSSSIDIAIVYGTADRVGPAELLLPTRAVVVCTEEVYRKAPVRSPADLRHHTLIHETPDVEDPACPSWPAWLSAVGAQGVDGESGPRFASPALVIDAALAGLGVALARDTLVAAEIRSGRLRRLFVDETRRDAGYWLLLARDNGKLADIQCFCAWLKEQIELDRAEPPASAA